MSESADSVAGLALPPKVTGKVSGHLVMKVDEVLWSRKPPGEVSAVVMWWGGDEPTTFRPTDVVQDSFRRKNTGVIYEIRTSLILFEKYLRKCGTLEIAVADKYGMPIGCASVSKLWQMIDMCPYQNYYPIVNNFGNRIGDIHVSFNLRMLPNIEREASKAPNKQGAVNKTLKHLRTSSKKQAPTDHKSKEEKTIRNERVSKSFHSTHEPKQPISIKNLDTTLGKLSDVDSDEESREKVNIPEEIFPEKLLRKKTSPTTNIISQILEHGTKLRDAMTASVMEDVSHLDFNAINGLSEMSQAYKQKAAKVLANRTDSFCVGSSSRDEAFQSKANAQIEKKVLDYLSGKPMSEFEEKEALEALRNVTPTRDILDNPLQYCSEEHLDSNPKNTISEDPKQIYQDTAMNISNNNEINSSVDNSRNCFDLDFQLLSQINCLRITVHSLVLNSLGVKRIGSSLMKKLGPSKSSIAVHPSGVTYFVEYKFPLRSASRQWESNVRYCSKRFVNDHEVMFDDRTIHNLPSTWRSSVSEQAALGSLISSLSFKVCARHLHQRVPVALGSAVPAAKTLLKSANLRHDFYLPVIGPDNLPVAQLRISLEFGRDRIHFGGLFDPENNSLGVVSPNSNASFSLKKKRSSLSKSVAARKNQGKNTTVTRNIHQKSLSASGRWRDRIGSHQAAQADRVIKQLVAEATCKLQQSKLSESSSAPSTARSERNKTFSKIPMSAFMMDCELSRNNKLQNSESLHRRFLKHEIALTILQVIDSNALRSSNDQALCVLYKFPAWNAMENESVEWISVSSEPLLYADGTWSKSQSRIHTVILPETESFQTFLQHIFGMRGMSKDGTPSLLFSVYARDYSTNIQDLLTAEAHLPLTCLSTLEDAFNEAAKSDPNFSSASCSSVVFQLPLHIQSAYKSQRHAGESSLKLKVDYRHSMISGLTRKSILPHSHGDSVIESGLECDVMYSKQREKNNLKLKKAFTSDQNDSQPEIKPVSVPNWARSPDKKYPSNSNIGRSSTNVISSKKEIDARQGENLFTDIHSKKEKCPHASWEPVQNYCEMRPMSRSTEMKCQRSENPKSMSDLKSIDHAVTTVPLSNVYNSKSSLHFNANSLSSQDSKSDCKELSDGDFDREIDNVSLETVSRRNTLKRDNSPSHLSEKDNASDVVQDNSTNTEPILNYQDKSNQVAVVNVTKESQTTPRISQDDWKRNCQNRSNQDIVKVAQGTQTTPRMSEVVLKRDIGTSADLEILPSENREDIQITSSHCAEVAAQRSTDNVGTDSEQDSISIASSEVRNYKIEKEDHSSSFVEAKVISQCEGTDNLVISSFLTKVGVECALHLQQPLDSTQRCRDQGEKQFVFVSFNANGTNDPVSSQIGLNPVAMSPGVLNNGEPEWNWYSEIQLPTDLLFSTVKRLVFRVWQSEAADHNLHEIGCCSLIGFSALDLTVLAVGLPLISGWFNVINFSGACCGQIKLSVEPLEDISRIVRASSLQSVKDVNRNSALSVYVAHCAYPEFPSHMTQFTDMRVQKVTPQPLNQAMSTVLSSYQLLLQHCLRSNSDDPAISKRQTLNEQEIKTQTSSGVSLPKNTEKVSSEKHPATKQPCISSTAIMDKSKLAEICSTVPQQNSDVSVSESVEEIGKDPSIVLREKLSELDKITENMKARLLSRVESAHITRSIVAPFGLPIEENVKSSVDASKMLNIGEADALKTAHHQPRNHIQLPLHVHKYDEEKIVSHKQRKTWERQEDLIDFGALQINCEDEEQSTHVEEQSPQIEDEAEWLSESALQQVFNPYFFNDILNSFNPNHSVKVVELDDIENSDDGCDPQAVACSLSSKHERSSPVVVKEKVIVPGNQRRSRRGNETYRKEAPHFSLNDLCASLYSGRSGLSAGDTDSGVDVDVSSNFQSGVFSAQGESQHNPHLLHNNRASRRGGSTERDESSSCSFVSSRHQSTKPSSLSASVSGTPTDSPQRSRQAPEGCNNTEVCRTRVALGKRRTAP